MHMIAFLVASLLIQTKAMPELSLIPQPKSVVMRSEASSFAPIAWTIFAPDQKLKEAVAAFREDIGRMFNSECKTVDKASQALLTLKIDPSLPHAYQVESARKIRIVGRDVQSVVWGMTTLLQAFDAFYIKDRPILIPPSFEIKDSPDSTYRGVLVDVARKYHSIDTLKQIVQLCRWYKINYLQLHLTDDQSFTFPSKAFPKLNSDNRHGGPSYTQEELRKLVAFADARGVTIIPEFDIPGHSATMVRTMPELFKIVGTKPYEHHATINFANPKVLDAVDTLIGEMCDVFKSAPYFHMGGDEADYANAAQHPDFQAAFMKNGLGNNATHEIYRLFLTQVNEMIKKRGKKTIVWEGFGRDPGSKFQIPKDITVMEFESAYYLPTDLLADGYTLINAAWTPLYVVNEHVWSPKKVFEWDLRKFGRFSTFYPATTWFEVPTYDRIIGGQVCAWEQPEYLAFDHLRRIVPAMAERTWNRQPKHSYDVFRKRLSISDVKLSDLAQGITIVGSNLMSNGPDDFDIARFDNETTVTLSQRFFPGPLYYTTDGSRPTRNSSIYKGPIKIDKTTTIRAAQIRATSIDLYIAESARTFYKDVSGKPNLATGKPVAVSGGTQDPQVPEFVVDNKLDLGSSWWAAPAPQWLKVDLKQIYRIEKIDVFPYWDGRRYYRYTVEVSKDGKTWLQVADKSENTVPASSAGDEFKIAPTQARYVRVNLLANSANEGVHLVELRVWGK